MLFKNRKYQLPLWLEVFTIIFLFTGFLVPIIVVIALFGIKPELEIYGIESSNPLSSIGLILLSIFLIKGIVALGILKERKWAFKLAKIDAFVGIIICIVQFGVYDFIANSSNIEFEFRLELFILFPYLIYVLKNEKNWIDAISK